MIRRLLIRRRTEPYRRLGIELHGSTRARIDVSADSVAFGICGWSKWHIVVGRWGGSGGWSKWHIVVGRWGYTRRHSGKVTPKSTHTLFTRVEYLKTSIGLDKTTLARLKRYRSGKGVSMARVIRSVLRLFPWWRTDRTNVVLSIPNDVANDPAKLSAWLDVAKEEVVRRLG